MAVNFSAHFLGDIKRAVCAATVHDHNLVCKLSALNALGNPTFLIHRQNANTQGGSIYRLHDAFHSNNPRKRDMLQRLGLALPGTVPCAVPPPSPLAASYMKAKAEA